MIRNAHTLKCSCFFCDAGQEHPSEEKRPLHAMNQTNAILTKAESLDPKDVVHTRMCGICTHEEVIEE